MTTNRPQFIVSNRQESQRLGFTPATVLLRLPLAWHALPLPERQRIVEREITRSATIAADKIAAEVG